MTRGEAAEVIDRLIAAYPRFRLDAPALESWLHAIAGRGGDFGRARAIAAGWANEHDQPPSLAAFLAAIAPPAAYQSPERTGRANPAMARRIVGLLDEAGADIDERSGGRGHWHGGPGPCGICGGIRPAAVRSTVRAPSQP